MTDFKNYFMEPERLSFQYNGIPFARIERESTEIEKDETHLEEFFAARRTEGYKNIQGI